ncbi:UMP-CMP kinase [Rhynchospora pubera]|uniref:adenylate kinase n=1 Tax=Rhynchospora pubera TaxID=906938 RepID=A0AAV8AJI4_9POAL|nr:UMP-CMP kinase [Rhynchospora pubera]
MNGKPSNKKMKVVFVLGGPGSGKGTQCAKIVEHFGFTHFSAGDLLRAETKSGSEYGTMIQNLMKEGKLVDSSIIVRLIQKAMLENENDKFLIDGFLEMKRIVLHLRKLSILNPSSYCFWIALKLNWKSGF